MSDPAWIHVFDPCAEAQVPVETVSGKVPSELVGTLYRNGGVHSPDVKHLFDGDGMIRALRFEPGGTVRYESRFVQSATHRYRVRNERCPGVGFGTRPRFRLPRLPGRVMGASNAGNTHVVYHNGALYALWEGGEAYEIDPASLETRGVQNFGGLVSIEHPFSAHPKLDPRTGTLWNFGMVYGRFNKIRLYAIDKYGKSTLAQSVTVPHAVINHDFVLSERHAVFFLCSMRARPNVLLMPFGLRTIDECMRWDERYPTLVVAVPLDGGEATMFETQSWAQFHFSRASEASGELLVDFSRTVNPDMFGAAARDFRHATFAAPYGQLNRARIDLKAGKLLSLEPRVDFNTEFPAVDPRDPFADDLVFTAATPKGQQGLQRAIGWLRPRDGTSDIYDFGAGCVVSEPVFVPRSPAAALSDGFLLAYVHDPKQFGTFIAVFDAQAPSNGPVYLGRVGVNAGFTFHGSWVAAT